MNTRWAIVFLFRIFKIYEISLEELHIFQHRIVLVTIDRFLLRKKIFQYRIVLVAIDRFLLRKKISVKLRLVPKMVILKVMLFRLKTALASYQRFMNYGLAGLLGIYCFVYLDDIVIFSENLKKLILELRRLFEQLVKYHVQLKRIQIQLNANFLRLNYSI
jgi:Reverse transcriptase (RNA-dependent DNA polymerase).